MVSRAFPILFASTPGKKTQNITEVTTGLGAVKIISKCFMTWQLSHSAPLCGLCLTPNRSLETGPGIPGEK